MMRGFIEDFKRIPQILDLIKKGDKNIPAQTDQQTDDGQLVLGL